MTDKWFINEKTLKELLARLEQITSQTDKDEQLKSFYQFVPEIKTPLSQNAKGCCS